MILYNTTMLAGMNDTSVTTGNADGWVWVPREALQQTTASPAQVRRPAKAKHEKVRQSKKAKR